MVRPTFFHPEDFGAVADGSTLNTQAFQAAIDACHSAGGGVVHCGPGAYRIGSIELKSHVELHLAPGCRIVASTDVGDYAILTSEGFRHTLANERSALYLIGARQAQHIAITGPGTVDGCGPSFYDASVPLKSNGQFAVKPSPRPRLVMLHRCTDVRIEDATFMDSPCWTMWLMCCERIGVRGVRIHCDSRLHNADGIDFDSCRDITVSDCIIHSQDDCLVFRAIQKLHEAPAICENFNVTNCVLSSDRGSIRISCPRDHLVRNGVFSNLSIRGPHHGIALHFPHRFAGKGGEAGAEVRNLMFSNITMDCGRSPIRMIIEDGIRLAGVSGIHFSNLRVRGGHPCLIQGSPETPFEDVSLSHVTIHATGEQALLTRHCKRLRMHDVEISHAPAPE